MEIISKESISEFIKSNLKELGGEDNGIEYVSEKLWSWYQSNDGVEHVKCYDDRFVFCSYWNNQEYGCLGCTNKFIEE